MKFAANTGVGVATTDDFVVVWLSVVFVASLVDEMILAVDDVGGVGTIVMVPLIEVDDGVGVITIVLTGTVVNFGLVVAFPGNEVAVTFLVRDEVIGTGRIMVVLLCEDVVGVNRVVLTGTVVTIVLVVVLPGNVVTDPFEAVADVDDVGTNVTVPLFGNEGEVCVSRVLLPGATDEVVGAVLLVVFPRKLVTVTFPVVEVDDTGMVTVVLLFAASDDVSVERVVLEEVQGGLGRVVSAGKPSIVVDEVVSCGTVVTRDLYIISC